MKVEDIKIVDNQDGSTTFVLPPDTPRGRQPWKYKKIRHKPKIGLSYEKKPTERRGDTTELEQQLNKAPTSRSIDMLCDEIDNLRSHNQTFEYISAFVVKRCIELQIPLDQILLHSLTKEN